MAEDPIAEDTIEIVAELSEDLLLQLDVETSARQVQLATSRVNHIRERRLVARDADIVLGAIRSGHWDPVYLGRTPGDPRRVLVVEAVEPQPHWVCIALKFVSSEQSRCGVDECFVSTGFPITNGKLTKWVQRGKLWVRGEL